MDWLLWRSEFLFHNKLLLYKQILKPVRVYSIQLWGCAKKVTSIWYKDFNVKFSVKCLMFRGTSEAMTFIETLRWKQLLRKSGYLLSTMRSDCINMKLWSDSAACKQCIGETSSESEAVRSGVSAIDTLCVSALCEGG